MHLAKAPYRRIYREEAVDSRYPNAYEMKLVFYIADEMEDAETLEQATKWISILPEEYGKWVEETVPRSSFDDDKSWIEAVTLKILRIAGERERIARTRIDLTGQTHRSANLRELTAKKSPSTRGSMLRSTERSRDLLN